MDSNSSNQLPNPKRLKTLSSDVRYPEGNNILHQFVLDNSDPNHSVSQNCINAVLMAMNGSGVDVNALNDDGFGPLHLAIISNNLLMVKKLLSCLVNIDVNARCPFYSNDTALHLAVDLGHLSIIRELLNKGADVNIKNAYENSALSFAVSSGNLDIVKLLVSKGANVDQINGGRGALHCAAISGNIEVLKYLVSIGADVNAKDDIGRTPLHGAVLSCNLATVEFLVSQGADINLKNQFGESPLCHAVERSRNLDIIKFLLDRCVNFNIESGNELLHIAATLGDLGTIQILIDKGADVNAKGKNHKTPLHEAVLRKNLEAIQFLVRKGADVNALDKYDKSPLHHVLHHLLKTIKDYRVDNKEVTDDYFMNIKLLLECNAGVNIADKNGVTALCCAMRSGNHEIIKLFSESAVYLKNIKDKYGITPLCYAVQHAVRSGSYDLIQYFLSKGADVNARNEDDTTPLWHAIHYANSDIVKLFLGREVDLNAKDIAGETLLHQACGCSDKLDIVEMLLTKGCDVNAKNEDGETPLHAAAYRNRSAYTQLLLERGASVHAADIEGETPLHIAADSGVVEVVRVLLAKGADKNAVDIDGKMPLDLAKENNHYLCMDALL